MDLQTVAHELVQPAHTFISDKLLPVVDWEAFHRNLMDYQEHRSRSAQVIVDALPAMACLAVGGDQAALTPVLAAWVLFLLGGRLMDDIADVEGLDEIWHQGGVGQSLQFGLTSISLANVALSHLPSRHVAVEISDAFNRALALAAKSQSQEMAGTPPSVPACLQHLAAKTGLVFAVGAWAGAHAGKAAGNSAMKERIYQYGLNAGIMTQLLDDYVDLEADLQQGVCTLPLAHGLSKTTHGLYPQLLTLWQERTRTWEWASQVKILLTQMGSLDQTLHMAVAYQEQAIAALHDIPTHQKSLLTAYVTQSYLPANA